MSKHMKHILSFGLATLALLFLAGCASTEQTRFKPLEPGGTRAVLPATNTPSLSNLLAPPTEAFTLGPGDRIEIEIFGSPLSRATAIVGPDGRVYYHLLPG